MDLTEKARVVFCKDRYAVVTSGIHIVRVTDDHEADCEMLVDDRHRNARGVVMGGALFTLADFAAAVAANSDHIESGELHWVSLNASIHYLSPATGSCLRAHSLALKHGRTTALYLTTLTDYVSHKEVAIVETTMMAVKK